MTKRLSIFAVSSVFLFAAYSVFLLRLLSEALSGGYTSHIVLIPVVIAYLIWSSRTRVFADMRFEYTRGGQLALAGVACLGAFGIARVHGSSAADFLGVLSVLLLCIAIFVSCFGFDVLRRAAFPISLLVFMLPMPATLISKIIHLLQAGSAELTQRGFLALGIPVLREGFTMTLPGVIIEVAEECSGINSSVALLIVMIIFAHETLESNWRRAALILFTLPLSMIKNAIRIVALTVLAIRVDPGFLTGDLHRRGGFAFFLISLLFIYPVWKLMRVTETSSARASKEPGDAAVAATGK